MKHVAQVSEQRYLSNHIIAVHKVLNSCKNHKDLLKACFETVALLTAKQNAAVMPLFVLLGPSSSELVSLKCLLFLICTCIIQTNISMN